VQSASCLGPFNPRERACDMYGIEGWMGPKPVRTFGRRISLFLAKN